MQPIYAFHTSFWMSKALTLTPSHNCLLVHTHMPVGTGLNQIISSLGLPMVVHVRAATRTETVGGVYITHTPTTHLPTHSHTHSLIHSTHSSLTHYLTHSPAHSTHSLTHSLTHPLTHWSHKQGVLHASSKSRKCSEKLSIVTRIVGEPI